jgi:hypothetical protein
VSRSTIHCRVCDQLLARVRPETGQVRPRPDVPVTRWDGPGVLVLRCPICGTERRVTVGQEQDRAA